MAKTLKCENCGNLFIQDESDIYGICRSCVSKAISEAWKETLMKLSESQN